MASTICEQHHDDKCISKYYKLRITYKQVQRMIAYYLSSHLLTIFIYSWSTEFFIPVIRWGCWDKKYYQLWTNYALVAYYSLCKHSPCTAKSTALETWAVNITCQIEINFFTIKWTVNSKTKQTTICGLTSSQQNLLKKT